MMRIGWIVLALVVVAASISVGAPADQEADKMFDGAYLYRLSCSGCHGAAGEGVSLFGPPLAGDAFITGSADDAIGNVIMLGRKYRDKMYPAFAGMPKFQFITGGELQSLIDYLKGPLQEGTKRPASGS